MTSLLLIFRFPNPDRGRAAKTHSGVFFKAAEEKRHVDKLPTHRCCIKAVSSYGITKYCMVLHGVLALYANSPLVSKQFPCSYLADAQSFPRCHLLHSVTADIHSTEQEKEQCTPIPKNTCTYTKYK